LKIGLLKIGTIDDLILNHLKENITKIFAGIECEVIPKIMPIPESAFNPARGQYHSSIILARIRKFTEDMHYDRVLGIVNVDLYVPHLNFVFGEAEFPGKCALISLFRLKPEFYGEQPNDMLFLERALKEAVHELGHTFGLRHCGNPSCVMFFSNSIIDTDIKGASFCDECAKKLRIEKFE